MIYDCKDCKTKCCSVGPGPYEVVPPETFLLNDGQFENFNKKCVYFHNELCLAWGTDKMPLECKTYVCGLRSFSIEELHNIKKLTGR